LPKPAAGRTAAGPLTGEGDPYVHMIHLYSTSRRHTVRAMAADFRLPELPTFGDGPMTNGSHPPTKAKEAAAPQKKAAEAKKAEQNKAK
jgi:hypothetical protein